MYWAPGIEFSPAKAVSFYLQASFGYTFPITFISTEAYVGTPLDEIDDNYPMVKKGFPSVNVQAGISFNF